MREAQPACQSEHELKNPAATPDDFLRERFFSYICHELRTPLTVIHSYAQLLQLKMPPGPEFTRQRQISELIVTHGDELVEMLEELLEATRIPLGRLNLDMVEYNLVEMLESLIDRLSPEQLSRLNYRLPSGPVQILAEGPRLDRALYAVLNFALQVSEPVVLELQHVPGTAGVRLLFQTPGYALAEEATEELFNLYRPLAYQDSSSYARTGTLDISLYVARGVIEGHKGQLKFDSGLGAFLISLPLAAG